jgi:peptidoglycan/xylan/chitin deacetylase (PgdA/CDA1 family)
VPRARTNALAALLLGAFAAVAAGREVVITIDDLPRGGDGGPRTPAAIRTMTGQLLQPFREGKIPLAAFVNQGRADEYSPTQFRQLLDLWLDAGADLGNHTYSHPSINNVSLREYTANIVKGEPALRAALAARGKKLEFFRHPFLHLGTTQEVKQGMQTFLDKRGYRVAPVTFDTADWEFAALYLKPEYHDRVRLEYVPYMESVVAFFERRAVEVAGREFPQILLIHASQMNADLMPDLLAMFRRRGYALVTLDHALADPAYKLPDGYVGPKGISWIHRWAAAKGMPGRMEPDVPAWVAEAFGAATVRKR